MEKRIGNELQRINDETEMFIVTHGGCTEIGLDDLIERIQHHWKLEDGFKLSDFTITSDYKHTRCLGYDLYDPADYDTVIHIKKVA
jgi:hypothetical protein